MMKVRDTVSYETVYVFYPDWGYRDDESELKKVSGLLEKFHIDHEESMFWHECFDKWRKLYDEDKHVGPVGLSEYLIAEGFVEGNEICFTEECYERELTRDTCANAAGFYLRDTHRGQILSVWQCLNSRGFIDRVRTDEGWNSQPLRTKSGKQVQSCLIGQLKHAGTQIPDSFVYQDTWEARSRLHPVTGEPMFPNLCSHCWSQHFWNHVRRFSPNTRVTAVEYHF